MVTYVLVGLLVGVADKWADESQAVLGHVGQFFGMLGTAAGLWALTLVLIALLNRERPLGGALNAASFFLGLCAGYYAYSQFVLGYSGAGVVLFWLLAACTAVPLLAAALVWTIRDGPRTVRLDVVRALVVGAFAAVPIAQAISYGFAVHPGNPSVVVSDAVAVVQVLLAVVIWLLLARTARVRLASLGFAALLAWPCVLLFANMARVMSPFGL